MARAATVGKDLLHPVWYVEVQRGCGNRSPSCQICVTCEPVVSWGVANIKKKLFPAQMLQCYETKKESKMSFMFFPFFLFEGRMIEWCTNNNNSKKFVGFFFF